MVAPLLLAWALLWCSVVPAAEIHPTSAVRDLDSRKAIVVAVSDHAAPVLTAGSTPRGYGGIPNYRGSQHAIATTSQLATEYHLESVAAWPIATLRLRCVVYAIPDQADRTQLMGRLRADERVVLVQSLNNFSTLLSGPGAGAARTLEPRGEQYNDPYVGLQRGFERMQAAEAQNWADGSGVTVALVDTGLDRGHPDLRGRIKAWKDFVEPGRSRFPPEQHGTEMAGVMAAVANNRIGIVGIAPRLRIDAYRACWVARANGVGARCNTFTLAKALDQAIRSGANIINLSLGGPSDPLLRQLLVLAMRRGAVVVAALPRSGVPEGFPAGVPGVIVVAGDEPAGQANGGVLRAPGRDILTLQPGESFDYASGSSLAAAQVSAVVALLLSVDRGLSAHALHDLLRRSAGSAPYTGVNACRALALLRDRREVCASSPTHESSVQPGEAHALSRNDPP